jgi:pyruvate/2-oxoglutarate dehydrogenase complex dihydrolipoamide dehydrogenase (E3) component
MTEEEALKKKNGSIRVIKIPYDTIDRAVTENKTTGLAKFILDKRNRILGVHILGVAAGEIIHEAALMKKIKKPLSYAKNYMHAYPSYSDVIAKAAQKAFFERTMNNPFVKLVLKIRNK